jgi:hypothetical protein
VSTGADSPYREPRLALQDLPDPLDLTLQFLMLISGEPAEWLNSHLNLPARATLVPDPGNRAVNEQGRIIARLAGWRQGARGRFAGK